MSLPKTVKIAKTNTFTKTTVAPAGVSKTNDKKMPTTKQTTEDIADVTVTLLKLLQILIELSAGKIIRLEMRTVPMSFIPTTIVTAVKSAIRAL